jgi:hypothetical protein
MTTRRCHTSSVSQLYYGSVGCRVRLRASQFLSVSSRAIPPIEPTPNESALRYARPSTPPATHPPAGALNDTLSWTTIRPLGVLPLDTRCRPADLSFEDGEAASGPPLKEGMWGACNTVRRLNGQDVCAEGKTPGACPSLEGPIYGGWSGGGVEGGWEAGWEWFGWEWFGMLYQGWESNQKLAAEAREQPTDPCNATRDRPPSNPPEHWLYGSMLRRTHNLLGGGTWSQQYVSDWWACDSAASDAKTCRTANISAPTYTERKPKTAAVEVAPGGSPKKAPDGPVVAAGSPPKAAGSPTPKMEVEDFVLVPVVESGLLNEPLLNGANWGSKDGAVVKNEVGVAKSGAEREGARALVAVMAAAAAAAALLV